MTDNPSKPTFTDTGRDTGSTIKKKNSKGDLWQITALDRENSSKGQERIQQAEQLRLQDIKEFNAKAEKEHQKRYNTQVEYDGEDYEISTYVKGKEHELPCYRNYIHYDKEKGKWIFDAVHNFKRRPPNDPEYSEEIYPKGYGHFDDEVERDNTQPQSHNHIVWNQLRAFIKDYGEEIDLDIFQGRDFTNKHDIEIMDTIVPADTGEKTLKEGTNEYTKFFAMDTAKSPLTLGVQMGKRISDVTVKKEEAPSGKIIYSTAYTYENFRPVK
jgi:hypothetical protein